MRRMYSKKELQDIIKTNLENGSLNIKAKTLEQSEANWSLPITSFGKLSNLTPEVSFGRVQKLNQELEFVISVKFTNETASPITGYSTEPFIIELPQEIAEKIFDCNGVSVKDASETNYVYIASSSAYASKSSTIDASKITGIPRLVLANSINANKMIIRFSSPSSITIDANSSTIIEGRIQLTLI